MHTHYLDTSSGRLAAARSGHHNRYLTSFRPTPPTTSLCLPRSTRVSLSLSPRIWIRGGSPASPLTPTSRSLPLTGHHAPPADRGRGGPPPRGSAPRSSSHHHDGGWLGRTTTSPLHHGVLSNCPAPPCATRSSPIAAVPRRRRRDAAVVSFVCPRLVEIPSPPAPTEPTPPSACSLMISSTCLDTVMAEVEDPLVKVAFDVCVT